MLAKARLFSEDDHRFKKLATPRSCLTSAVFSLATFTITRENAFGQTDEGERRGPAWWEGKYGCGSKPMGSHFGCTHDRTLFEWLDWDVHWGYGLGILRF